MNSKDFDSVLMQHQAGVPAVLSFEMTQTARAAETALPLSRGEEYYLNQKIDLFGSSDCHSQDPLRFKCEPAPRQAIVPPAYSAEQPGPGRKDDSAKARVDLLPFKALAAVYEHGADDSSTRGATDESGLYDEVLDHLTSFLAKGHLSELAQATRWSLALLDPCSPHILPGFSVEQVVKVLEFGAAKYAENNWQRVENGVKRYTSAALRHLFAWSGGQEMDPESGLPHIAHAACSLMFALHLASGKIA